MMAVWERTISIPLSEIIFRDVRAGGFAVRREIKDVTGRTKRAIRKAITNNGMSRAIANTVRDRTYPEKVVPTLSPVGLIWSKALYQRAGGLVDLITVFDEDTKIAQRTGRLVIPTLDAGQKRITGGRMALKRPGDFPENTFKFIPFGDGRKGGRLVFRKRPKVVAFWLVEEANQPRRINVDEIVEKQSSDVAERIVANWERRSQIEFAKPDSHRTPREDVF